jgi:hypothetical protein
MQGWGVKDLKDITAFKAKEKHTDTEKLCLFFFFPLALFCNKKKF